MLGDPRYSGHPAAAGGTDHPVLQAREEAGIVGDIGVGRLAARLAVSLDSSSEHQR